MKKLLAILTLVVVSNSFYTQETAISNSPITTCEGFIVDTGMTAGDAGSNENFTQVICSDGDTIMNLFFNLFALGSGDTLVIYDGSDTDAPLVGTYVDYDLSQQNITSSNPNGCLTLVWTTDAEDSSNFTAEMSCEAPCIPPFTIVTTNEGDTTHVIYSCPGEEVIFDASQTIFADGTLLSSFEWQFSEDDTDDTSWPIANHVFEEPGGYFISLNVIDDNECESNNVIDIVVLVSTYPAFTQPELTAYCLGEGESILEGGVDVPITTEIFEYGVGAVPFDFNFGGLDGDSLFIPDDQTTCFESQVEVSGFTPGATIESVDLIENLFINFEHSFMGDLTITFICPNNQNIAVHQQGGGGTNLGTPDQGDGTGPGDGFDYWWSPDATNGTWADNATGVLPSGTYESVQGFSSLVGCPINGVWTVQICDSWGADDGYIFDWHIEFDSTLYPEWATIIPNYGLDCDSTYFSSDYFIQNDECELIWSEPITEVGSYPITITTTNDFGCVFTDEVTFLVVGDPIPDAGIDQQLCDLDQVVQLNGASTSEYEELGDYIYTWSPSTLLNDSTILNPTVDSTATGSLTYILTVSPVDHPLCAHSDSVNIVIVPTTPPEILSGGITTICANGEVTLTVADIYQGYEWDNDPSLSTSSISAAPGTHTVTVYFDEDCPVTDEIVISSLPQAAFVDYSECHALGAELVYFTEGNPQAVIPGSWNYSSPTGSLTFNNPTGSNTFITASEQGTYNLTFTDECGFIDSFTSTFMLPPNENQFAIDPIYIPCEDEAPWLLQPSGSDFEFYSYSWSNGDSTPTTTVDESGIYTFTAENECGFNEISTTVTFISCHLIIPNIFTPNNLDTLNSSFVIDGLHFFPGSKLTVFNRWGNIVYESEDYKNNWSPGADEVADGTYYYVLNVNRRNDDTDDYSGYVQILR